MFQCSNRSTFPGLYDPSMEKDACGVGFIVHIDGKKTHDVLVSAQELSRRWVTVIVRICSLDVNLK